MDPATLDALKANYQAPPHLAGIADPQKRRSGLAGFIEGAGRTIVHPFSTLIGTDIVNPIKTTAAQLTGNKQAYNNSIRNSNLQMGLGENGTDVGNAFKQWAGNSAQALLTVAAPEAKTFKQGAAIGAGFGGSSAAAQQGSTLEDVLKQAAIGGAIGGTITSAGNGLKFLKGNGAAKLGAGATEMEGRAAGIGTGEKVAGSPMKVSRQEDLLKWGQDNGMPVGKARNMAKWTESKANEINQKLDSAIKVADRPLEPTKAVSLGQKFRDAINSDITLRNNPEAQKLADQLQTGISEIDTLGNQITERRNLQNGINFNRSSASPDPLKERIFDTARRVLNEDINTISPEIKAINSDYNKISDIEQGVLGAAGRLTRASEAGSGGNSAVGMLLKGDTAQEVKSVMGRFGRNLSEKAGAASDVRPAGNIRSILGGINNAAKQTGLGANPGAVLALNRQGNNAQQLDTPTDSSILPADTPTENTSTTQTPFNSENIQRAIVADVAANGGKNVSSLVSLYNTFGKPEATAAKLSTSQQSKKDSLQTALASLEGATQNLTAAGGAQGPKGIIGTIPGIGKYLDSQGAAYHDTKIELATQLAKAITGGSRPSQGVIDKYMHSLPDINDPPDYAQAKVDKLKNELYTQARVFKFNDLLSN